jgi:uncharacterized beta-barrel protein YwiB (DUF1934 family)
MTSTKSFDITVSSTIENIGSDTEVTETSAAATVRYGEGGTEISYRESDEGGDTKTVITVCADSVTVARHGALESVLVFREGEVTTSIYAVGPYKFDAEIKTKKIRNSLSEIGGTLALYYNMTVGGADKWIRMKICLS